MGLSQDLYKKAKEIIPGGTQLLSKRPEMFLPDLWPAYYKKAKGCEIWDLDGKKYVDMSHMGIGSCILGYADSDVDSAVKDAINKGSMATLNAPEEVELAEKMIQLHPWAGMVRYARTGGEAMTIAMRIARAATGKDVVLFSGYHGWHDWYLAANLSEDKALDGQLLPGLNPLGVPRGLKGTSFPFYYNDVKGFLRLINRYKGTVGAVVLETIRNQQPEIDFLRTIKQITSGLKIVLVVDEITSGFRFNIGGAHLLYNLEPDIAVFAKGISNGYPMAVITGKKKVMEAAQETFISSTYWTDRIGPVAALATIRKLKSYHVPDHLAKIGKMVQKGWKRLADQHGVKIEVSGICPLSHFSFKSDKHLILKTLFTQLMLERGFLATNAFYASYAHKGIQVKKYLKAVDEVFRFIEKAIRKGNPAKHLKGPISHSGFRRLT